jgi:hypothetical protein
VRQKYATYNNIPVVYCMALKGTAVGFCLHPALTPTSASTYRKFTAEYYRRLREFIIFCRNCWKWPPSVFIHTLQLIISVIYINSMMFVFRSESYIHYYILNSFYGARDCLAGNTHSSGSRYILWRAMPLKTPFGLVILLLQSSNTRNYNHTIIFLCCVISTQLTNTYTAVAKVT